MIWMVLENVKMVVFVRDPFSFWNGTKCWKVGN